MFHRRYFLKSTAAAIAALNFPRNLLARTPNQFFFIHADSCTSFPTADPVTWALERRSQPILERAAEGLAKLSDSDGEQVLRLVVRRCGLNLLELQRNHVNVHHWGQQQTDLRPFFKQHGLARSEIEVVLRDRKREIITTKTGDSFLYGTQIAEDFPLAIFQSKFANRFTNEPDDWQAAPSTNSGFAWDGIEDGQIPWAAMKSAWRRAAGGVCLNCDTPTILVNFGLPWTGMLSRTPRFEHVCGKCLRVFRDETVDVKAWMAVNLDENVQPGFEMVWGKRVMVEGKS